MRRSLALLLALLTAGSARAQAEPPDWRVSGYYTLGHATTSSDTGWRFARDQTQAQPGAWEVDSRFGLQLDARLTGSLDAAVQTVLRRRVPGTPAAHAVEWAYLRWTPSPDWQLRLGRTNPDVFLFADVRSVGIAYPWVRPSQEFYAWMPLQALDGLDVTRSWDGDDATWRLKLSFAHGQLRASAQDSATPGDATIQAIRTLTLSRDTPTTRLKFSYLRTRVDLRRISFLAQAQQGLDQLQAQVSPVLPALGAQARDLRDALGVQTNTQYVSLGGQHEQGAWSWVGEWSRIWGDQARQTNATRAYASLGRRFDVLTPFVIVGSSHLQQPALDLPLGWQAQLTPLVGPALAAQAQQLGLGAAGAANLGRMSQHSSGIGLRWDARPTLALKAQWDLVRVDANGRALWALRPGAANTAFTARVLSFTVDGSF
jgi:hypothetical protein